jgi:hypothetical protein
VPAATIAAAARSWKKDLNIERSWRSFAAVAARDRSKAQKRQSFSRFVEMAGEAFAEWMTR